MSEGQNSVDGEDVRYALKKAGIDLEVVHKERLAAEAAEKARIQAERLARIEAGRRARNERADKELVDGFGEFYFLTLNGKRLAKLKATDDLKCPECGAKCQPLTDTIRDFILNESTPGDIQAQAQFGAQRVIVHVNSRIRCPECEKTFTVWCERLRKPVEE